MDQPVNSKLLRQISVPLVSGDMRGVACLIARDRALTVEHLVRHATSLRLRIDNEWREATTEFVDDASGLALIAFRPPLGRDVPEVLWTAESSAAHARFLSLGYPSDSDNPVLVAGTVIGEITRDNKTYLQLGVESGVIGPGFSGGPVVVADRVVGLLASMVPNDRSTAFVAQFSAAGAIETRLKSPASADPSPLDRLSPSSRAAVARAEGMRRALNQPEVHMEHLIAGLYEEKGGPTELALSAAGVDAAKLREVIRTATHIDLPTSYSPVDLTAMPPLSNHAQRAFEAAARLGTDLKIHARDLFAGAMSIANCGPVKALLALGVHATPSAAAANAAAAGEAIAAAVAGFRSDSIAGQTDLLDIKRDVEALCSVIAARDVEPPLSIGLFGDWGSGKSFFIEEMKKQIGRIAKAADDAERKANTAKQSPVDATRYCARIAQLEFNAWRYIDTQLWASLTDGIIDGLARAMEDPTHITTTATERARLLAAAARSRDVLGEAEARKATAEQNLARQEQVLQQAIERANSPKGVEAVKREAHLLAVSASQALRRDLDEVREKLGADETTNEARAMLLELGETWGLASATWQAIREKSVWFVVGAGMLAALAYLEVQFRAQLDKVAQYLLGFTGTIASLVIGLGPYIKKARDAVQAVRTILDKHNAALEAATQQATAAEHTKRDRLVADIAAAERRRTEAQLDLEQIEAQLSELRADKEMATFLKERQASDDYRKHFGVIGRARSDFERLSDLLVRTRDEAPRDGLPRIDRIVLYIDDLDRCEEKQVVDVLQAVHLLLAFKLFVVVVAVDSRWLLHSLQQHSSAFQTKPEASQDISEEERLHWQSTPLNYLEKIFQVPFTLKPVGEGGFKNMIDYLTAPLAEPKPIVTQPATPPPPQQAAAKPDGQPAVSPAPAAHPPPQQPVALAQPPTVDAIDVKPPHLVIEPWEQSFMKEFHDLIGTPRAIKRFVNVYRLLKARVPDERVQAFRGDATRGEYRAAMFLLALLIGFPSEATDLLRDLTEHPSSGPWWDWIVKFLETETTIAGSEVQRERLSDVSERLAMIRARFATTGIDLPAIEVFRFWTPYVARFSFQAGRLSASTFNSGAVVAPKSAEPPSRSKKPSDGKASFERADM